jgi:hypothetical protein
VKSMGLVAAGLVALCLSVLLVVGTYSAGGFTRPHTAVSCLDHAPEDWHEAVRLHRDEWKWVPPGLRCSYENTLTGERAAWDPGYEAVPFALGALATGVLGLGLIVQAGILVTRPREHPVEQAGA